MCISIYRERKGGGCKIWSTNIILHVHVCYRVLIAKTAIHLGIKCQKCAVTKQSLSILLKIESSKKKIQQIRTTSKQTTAGYQHNKSYCSWRVMTTGRRFLRKDDVWYAALTESGTHTPTPHPRDPCRYTQLPRPL